MDDDVEFMDGTELKKLCDNVNTLIIENRRLQKKIEKRNKLTTPISIIAGCCTVFAFLLTYQSQIIKTLRLENVEIRNTLKGLEKNDTGKNVRGKVDNEIPQVGENPSRR